MKDPRKTKTARWTLSILFAAASVASGCVNVYEGPVPTGALIVDVRTPGEYEREYFPGAVNIPVDQVEERLDEFGRKDRTIMVYCRSGRRSENAKEKLLEAGYRNVINGGGLRHMLANNPKKEPVSE